MANSLFNEVQAALRQTSSRNPASDVVNEANQVLRDADENSPLQFPDVVAAGVVCLGVAVAAGLFGFVFLAGNVTVYLIALIAALAVGFWAARRSPVRAPLALGYSALLGVVAGAFTGAVAASYGSALVIQAVLGTVFGAFGILAVTATPWGQRAGRATRLFTGIALGYLALALVSLVTAFAGVGNGWGLYGLGPFGLLLSLAGVTLAAWSLLVDLTATADAVASGAPRRWRWSFGMAVAGSLVWMYVELLRLLALTRN